MDSNLEGRVNNISLSEKKPLLPLFEAIINSIHAIEDKNITDGEIEIQIIREVEQTGIIDDGNLSMIDGFSIIDNGIGFDTNNFKSFSTSDTLYKKNRGSKGIGRLLWLKAFADISVESVYIENGKIHKRNIDFNFKSNGVKETSLVEIQNDKNNQLYTKIDLKSFLIPYRRNCPQSIDKIGKSILEHCISYFAVNKVPKITLRDGNDIFILNEYFAKNLETFVDEDKISIKDQEFFIKGIKYYNAVNSSHKLFYCANNRTVLDQHLDNFIPNLLRTRKIRDADNSLFTYLAFVSSKFLDRNVNQERTDFNIDDDHTELSDALGVITKKDIQMSVVSCISENLDPFLQNIQEKKIKDIHEHILNDAPEYRPLLKHSIKEIESIKPGLSEQKLDIELHKIKSSLELSLKQKSSEILNTPPDNFDQFPEYKEKYYQFLEQYNDLGKSKLAEYIVHRRIILDIFEKNLRINDDNRYKLEKDIHELIHPMRTSSDDMGVFSRQNLWIIDERLTYHQYLSSDKPLKNIDGSDLDSSNKPDLLVLNNPMAFVPDQEQPYTSVVIVEFKRPMRGGYSASENPIAQVYSYIEELQSGKYTARESGRLVSLREKTPFYAYVICDINSDIHKFSRHAGLKKTPDLQGYFGFNTEIDTYIEVLSFDKMINDSKQRNNILFRTLGI